jgi:threonine dehydratase
VTPSTADANSPETVTFAAVQAAAERLRGQVLDTPCLESRTLSAITGARVVLKFENLQFTAAFKERGALNALTLLLERQGGPRGSAGTPFAGVIAASAGNHAQGLAHHAQRLRVPAVIVMPLATPMVKVERTRGFGAEVVLHGDSFDDARRHAEQLAQARGLHLVHPFDDADVIAGQGTVALEMLQAHPELDVLIVAVGGGGLLSGMAVAARAIKPGIELVGVQASRYASMVNALHGTAHAIGPSTIAEGIAVAVPGTITRELVRRHVDALLTVDEGDIEEAIVMLLEVEKTLVEGAGAAGLAALLRHRERFVGRTVGLVLCGGNIDPLLLAAIIERGMVRAGRLARLAIGARDAPGVLARITAVVAAAGANIDEVRHQRAFSALSAQHVDVELVVQTRGREHVRAVVEALRAAGFDAHTA